MASNNNVYVAWQDDATGKYYINSYDSDGVLLDTWETEATENIGNALAVDVSNNVYTVLGNQHSVRKRNSSGTIILTKTETNYIYNIAIGPDGYIYTLEFDSAFNSGYISKRNASDLVSVDTLEIDASGSNIYYGFAIDADGDFYVMKDSDGKYERWNWDTGLVSSVTADHTTFNSLGVSDALIADIHWGGGGHGIITAKDLSGVETDVNLEDLTRPGSTGSVYGEHFLFSGYDEDSMLVLGKYDTSLTKVWTVVVPDSSQYGYGSIGSYPFAEITVTYDYPLSPILFPAQHKGTPLRKKCIHFEESVSDICLNMNNNTKVIRGYLKLTHGDTKYNESSNLRDVLPSQQLVKLMNKDLAEEDFKAIINNFITNVSSMFTLINENNVLVKTWLDDYKPDEEGHDFTDVKMKPIIIGKDLSKTMDALFEGMEDNVTILNMNLEVLKERF